MGLIFLNGTSPDYSGLYFTSIEQLINAIENTLQTAGWAVIDKPVDGLSLFMKGITTEGGHECYVEFKVTENSSVSNGYYLDQRGFSDEGKSAGSPADVLRHTFVVGSANRLWLTADNDSGALAILDANNTMRGAHFGFLNRIDTTDDGAWMIGWIHSLGYQYAYVAKTRHNGTAWRRLSDDYRNYTNTSDGQSPALPFSTFDFLQRGGWNHNYYTWASSRNPWYNAAHGRLNYTGSPIIDPYCYHEGRGSNSNYPVGSYAPSYFRGYVKHVYCGVASLDSGAQVVDRDGYRILSTGTSHWQGMRIL